MFNVSYFENIPPIILIHLFENDFKPMRKILLLMFLSGLCGGVFSQQTDSLVLNKWENGFPKEVKILMADSSWRIQKYFFSQKLQCIINYDREGRLHGPEKCWYETGSIKQESYWQNGINYGTSILWYPSGQKSFEGGYLENGSPHGAWKGWYENGQVRYEQYYSNGTKTGKWINYKKSGGVDLIQYYENGNLVKEEKF